MKNFLRERGVSPTEFIFNKVAEILDYFKNDVSVTILENTYDVSKKIHSLRVLIIDNYDGRQLLKINILFDNSQEDSLYSVNIKDLTNGIPYNNETTKLVPFKDFAKHDVTTASLFIKKIIEGSLQRILHIEFSEI